VGLLEINAPALCKSPFARRGEYMFYRSVSPLRLGRLLAGLSLFICYRGSAQDNVAPASHALRVTHLLGLQGLKDNTNGTLTIQADTLRFQPHDGTTADIKISSMRGVALGVQDQEVGGMPLAIGRAAAPYGGGRLIALFAHKKYDIVTVEYRDADGSFHGAIFQLNKGEAQALKKELEAGGAHVTEAGDHRKRQKKDSHDNK
jgi:hypothetical protein